MMRTAAILLVPIVFSGFSGFALPALADGDVNIYSYRQPELIQPALDAFTRKTGLTANVLFLDKGLIERMQAEGENSPADVILTVDVARLDELKQAGVTQPLADATLSAAIPAKFRDPDGQWFGLGMDARVIYAARERVRQEALDYADLAKPEWKGRLCLRDGQHSSNLGLFADMISAHGAAFTETWLTGMKANLASRPSGSDAGQVQAIAEGRCDVALGNATIIAAMLTGAAADELEWAKTVRVILPNATYGNISGMGLGRHAPNRANAIKLMQFLASREAQQLYAQETLEYPVVEGAAPADFVKAFGTLKPDGVPMSDIIKYRNQASELVDKVGFNDGPNR